MFGYYSKWIYYVSTALLLVNGYNAQLRVTVTFDPPSPVPEDSVTMTCDFTLPAGTTLSQQYWEIIDVGRIFEYTAINGSDITPGYEDKILTWDTDYTSYLHIVYNLTACDVGKYKCFVFASDTRQGEDTQSIEVENIKTATLKNDSIEITEDTTIPLKIPVDVSCTLADAGPPLPQTLTLEQRLGNESEFSTVNFANCTDKGPCKSNETCKWTYEDPVTVEVNDVNGTEIILHRCRIDYKDNDDSVYSPVLTLIPMCPNVTCDNGGTCFVDGGLAQCFCPEDIYGDFCEDISCVNNSCNPLSTCFPEDSDDLDYTCNCTGYNLYGPLCYQPGCLTDEPGGCTCKNGGNCTDTLTECYCNCTEGCTGESCEIFEEGDQCEKCTNSIFCSQTCDSFDCACDYNWNGTYCNQSCIWASDSSFEPGTYNVTLGDPIGLYCDSDEATSIYWVDGNENLVHNGTNLTIEVSYMANNGSYFCRLKGPDCTQQIEYFLEVIPPDIVPTNETTPSNDNYTIESGENLGPLVAQIKQDSGLALNDPVITLWWLHDDKPEANSTSGTVTYFVPAIEVGEDDEGTYTAVATYLDYTQTLTTIEVFLIGNFVPEPVPTPDGPNGPSDGEIAGIVIGVFVAVALICVAGVFAYRKRDDIAARFKSNEPSDESGQKKSGDNHELRGEDNKIPVNDSPQKENLYSEPRKFKQRSNQVGPDPQREINKQRRPHGGERLAPIGHSEPEQTAANESETSPKRKKKRRRRRKAPDGQPDMSPGEEDRFRPLPVPSSRPLPPIEHTESPVHNGVQSTPL